MGDISRNFNRNEFACKCGCGFDTVDVSLVYVLQTVRNYFGKPVRVTSGCRCFTHNMKVGGVKNSRHKLGKACDFQIDGISPYRIHVFLTEYFESEYAFGVYDTFNHVDVRAESSRWDNRS